jgi:endonuclease/exonuclease/phosphatase family metal-dependent hydrolase
MINFHGIWNGKGKGDSDDRIMQSKNIIDFTKSLNHDFVLVGDFNLLPDTESIKLFEDTGLKNLIKEYGITSTRTSFYTKPIPYADYAFVTKGIKIKEFKVLPEEVSDHAALCLEIE